jgi:hypothetical protein
MPNVPLFRAVLLGRYDKAIPVSDQGPDPFVDAAQALRARFPPSDHPLNPEEPMTDKPPASPWRRRPIDLHPWTTKEERQTLSKPEIRNLRHQRREEARAARNLDPMDEGIYRDVRLPPAILRVAARLGLVVALPVLAELIEQGMNAQFDPDELRTGAWTAAEIAVEIRPFLVERIDEWLDWEKPAEGFAGLLAALGFANADKVSGALAAVAENVDGAIIDALLGPAIEDYTYHVVSKLLGARALAQPPQDASA